MKEVLKASGLIKQFGKFTAVNGISFTVGEGEIVGLLGQNGAGKTTTLSMLLGLLTPTTGAIKVFGKDLEKNRGEILNQVNFSSAYIEFPSRLTVMENLNVFSLLYDISDRKKRILEVMEIFNVTKHKNTRYMYLSSGERTRVHLAKAFLNRPKLLLLDEPTAALDPDIADMVRNLLLKMQEKYKLTVLLTSHNMAEVEQMCDRVVFIDKGKVIAINKPENLAKLISKTTIRLLVKDGLKRTLEYCNKHKFEANIEGRTLAIRLLDEEIIFFLSFLAERGIKYQEISIDKPNLQDYFLEKTRGVKK
ncbi:ABC transporter ATP-binding protein [Patescibacteria group bacterium]